MNLASLCTADPERIDSLRRAAAKRLFDDAVTTWKKGGKDLALERLRQAQEIAGSPATLLKIAEILHDSGDRAEAFATLKSAVALYPDCLAAHRQAARLHEMLRIENDPERRAERDAMLRAIAAMEAEIKAHPSYVPSLFWSTYGNRHLQWLAQFGIENLKRTVNHNYQNWAWSDPANPQIQALIKIWKERGWDEPLLTTVELTTDLGHPGDDPLAYRLGDPQALATYKLGVSILQEHVMETDSTGDLARLEESPIGNPIRIRRRVMLISQDLAHSIRERNQILRATGWNKDEEFVVAELGAGFGRLAECFGLTTNYKYVIFDISPTLYVSQWYIQNRFPNEKIFTFRSFESFDEIRDELAQSRFAFFTPNQIEQWPAGSIDLFINISSLQEMIPEQVTNYLNHINRLTRRAVYFKQYTEFFNNIDSVWMGRSLYVLPGNWRQMLYEPDAYHPALYAQTMMRDDQGGADA
jgi:putative sugar O-methyltransferase